MPAIITTKFRINNSEQFHESFTEASPNVYYIGLARPQAFATPTRGDGRTDYEGTDSNPITPGDTVIAEFNTFKTFCEILLFENFNCSTALLTF